MSDSELKTPTCQVVLKGTRLLITTDFCFIKIHALLEMNEKKKKSQTCICTKL